MELLKLLSANEVVTQIACFLILLAILRVALWKRILAMLDARKEKIASEFRSIEAIKSSVETLKSEYSAKLSGIDEEANARIRAATDRARQAADAILVQSERDGEKLIANAKDSIRDEVAKAKEELKDTVVDLTIRVAEKVIQEKLTAGQDKRLIEEFIEGIEKK